MYSEPVIIRHTSGFPPLATSLESPDHNVTPPSVCQEAAAREMAMLEALNRGTQQRLPSPPDLLKLVVLPDDAERIAKLDEAIYSRGVAVNREKLVKLGRGRFDALLAADREARTERVIGPRCDLTSWPHVFVAVARAGAVANIPVPIRATSDQFAGRNQELDQVRRVESFVDLWKCYGSEPRAVRHVYSFRDTFELLVFGQNLFTWTESNGRVYHEFLASGAGGDKVRLFEQWLAVLEGPHYRVKITNALHSLVFWMAGESNKPPNVVDLAREWFSVRLPSQEQIQLAQAVCDGFAVGLKDWNLWEYVGRAIRKLPDRFAISAWRDQLRGRYRNIDAFYRGLQPFFQRQVAGRYGGHQQFEVGKYRAYIDKTLADLLDCASAVAALTIEENSPVKAAPVAARFREWVLCAGKPKTQITERIEEKLAAAFLGAHFTVEVIQ